jgi:hypothetical protein
MKTPATAARAAVAGRLAPWHIAFPAAGRCPVRIDNA